MSSLFLPINCQNDFTYSDEKEIYTVFNNMQYPGTITIVAEAVFIAPEVTVTAQKIIIRANRHFTSYGRLACETIEIQAPLIHITEIRSLKTKTTSIS